MPITSRERLMLAEEFLRSQREEFAALQGMGPVQSFIQNLAADAGFITPRARRAFQESLAFNQEMAQEQVQGLLNDLLDVASHTHSPQNTELLAQTADELGRIQQELYGPDPGAAQSAIEKTSQLRGLINGVLESERAEQRELRLERRGELRQRGNEVSDALREETLMHGQVHTQISDLMARGTDKDAPISDILRGQLMNYLEVSRVLRGTDAALLARIPGLGGLFSTDVEPISLSEAANMLDKVHDVRNNVLSNEFGLISQHAEQMGLEPFITKSGSVELRDVGLTELPERLAPIDAGEPTPARVTPRLSGPRPEVTNFLETGTVPPAPQRDFPSFRDLTREIGRMVRPGNRPTNGQ